MTFVGTRIGIEYHDTPVAVAVRHKEFVGSRINIHIGGAIDVLRVVAARTLAAAPDLQHKLPVAGEFQDLVVTLSFARNPNIVFVIHKYAVDLERPFVSLPRTSPALKVISCSIKLDDRGSGQAAVGGGRI